MHRLTLLGGATLEDATGLVEGPVARRYPLALLALLATAPSRTLSRGKLVGLLWPDAPEDAARNRLTNHVHRVRSDLGEAVLVSAGDDLRLNGDALTCDVWEFEAALEEGRLEEAVELYGGPFLDGFRLPDAPTFEKRVDRTRTGLRRARLEALETLAERASASGEPEAAAGWWRRRAAADPYDSRVTARLMEALAAAGNRAAALRAAGEHAELLREELGTGPDAEVRELAERLREGEAPREPEGDGTEPAPPAREAAAEAAPSPAPAGAPAGPGRGWLRVAGAAAVLLLASGVWYLTVGAGDGGVPAGERSIAVLPFEAAGREAPDPVTEGLHSDLLTRLSRVPGLEVISATSVLRFDNASTTTAEVARELGVRWVLEGSVQQAGGELQMNVQLIDPRTDTHAWAETYRRPLTAQNLFDLQEEITGRIARVLEARLAGAGGTLVRPRTADLQAHRLYVRGRSLLEQRRLREMRGALDYFRRALARDSGYALAWAGMADALTLLTHRGEADPDSALGAATRAAERALELAPDLAEAHAALGRVRLMRADGPGTLRSLERAVELRPSYASAHTWLGKLLLSIGRPGEALPEVERAVRLGPMGPENWATLAWARTAVGDHEGALAAARRVSELRRGDDLSRGQEAFPLFHLRREEALREVHEEMGVPAEETLLWPVLAAESGDLEPARERLEEVEPGEAPVARALLLTALGREERAVEVLLEGYPREGRLWDTGYLIVLRYDFPRYFGRLRDEPGYRELERAMYGAWGLEPDGSLPGEGRS